MPCTKSLESRRNGNHCAAIRTDLEHLTRCDFYSTSRFRCPNSNGIIGVPTRFNTEHTALDIVEIYICARNLSGRVKRVYENRRFTPKTASGGGDREISKREIDRRAVARPCISTHGLVVDIERLCLCKNFASVSNCRAAIGTNLNTSSKRNHNIVCRLRCPNSNRVIGIPTGLNTKHGTLNIVKIYICARNLSSGIKRIDEHRSFAPQPTIRSRNLPRCKRKLVKFLTYRGECAHHPCIATSRFIVDGLVLIADHVGRFNGQQPTAHRCRSSTKRDFMLNSGDTPLPTRFRAVRGVAWCS